MRRQTVSIEVNAPCEVVFDLIHDYDRRLQWDTMLSEARLLGGATAAGKNVRTRCVGTWRSAFIPMETEYISFKRGKVAAVRLTNRPLLFDQFAASIRHQRLNIDRSRVIYRYWFRARPRVLRPAIEPLVDRVMSRQVAERLDSLRRHLESNP